MVAPEPSTQTPSYPDWQSEIRLEQDEVNEQRAAARAKEEAKRAAQLREQAQDFYETLLASGLPVPEDLSEPQWTPPDGTYRFEYAERTEYYGEFGSRKREELRIYKPVAGASEDVLDEYADYIDGGWLDGYRTEVYASIDWNMVNGIDIVEALDDLTQKAQDAAHRNPIILERLRAQEADTPANADDKGDGIDWSAIKAVSASPEMMVLAIHEFMKSLARKEAKQAVRAHRISEDEIYDRV